MTHLITAQSKRGYRNQHSLAAQRTATVRSDDIFPMFKSMFLFDENKMKMAGKPHKILKENLVG